MVKVLLCHHFTSQKIYCPKNEPIITKVAENLLIVACLGNYLEVYSLNSVEQCIGIVTKGQVLQVELLSQEKLVVTLESVSQTWQTIVNVYHIQNGLESFHCNFMVQGLASPACVTVDAQSNNIALGSKERVALYHIAGNLEKPNSGCYKVIFLIEVNMSFLVKDIYICEEYILCKGDHEVQLVGLQITLPISKTSNPDLSYLGAGCHFVSPHLREFNSRGQDSDLLNTEGSMSKRSPTGYSEMPNKSHSGIRISPRESSGKSQRSPNKSYIEDDEHHILLETGQTEANGYSDGVRSKWLASVRSAVEELSQTTQQNEVIIGPIQNHPRCAVFISHVGNGLENKVDKNVLTYLYKWSDGSDLTQIQLTPIYKHTYDRKYSGSNDSESMLISKKRGYLELILCYVSTPTEGYLYSIANDTRTRMLQKYTYTTEIIQFCLSQHQLYVASASGVEVYSVDSTARAIVRRACDNSALQLFPSLEEPCMIGFQPFFSVKCLSQSNDRVVVLSKSVTNEEKLWTIYVLQIPGPTELATDMLDLADLHRTSSQGTYRYMIHQAYSYLWAFLYINTKDVMRANTTDNNETKHSSGEVINGETNHHIENPPEDEQYKNKSCVQLLQKVALLLGKLYASSTMNSLCIPYLLQTAMSVNDVICSCVSCESDTTSTVNNNQSTCDHTVSLSPCLWNYVDFVLFMDHQVKSELVKKYENIVVNDAKSAHFILDLFVRWRPSLLSTVIVTSSLKAYKTDYALNMFTAIDPQLTSNQHTMDSLALSILYQQQGKVVEAENTLKSISHASIKKLCYDNSSKILITYDGSVHKLTHLAELLSDYRPDMFTELLTSQVQEHLMDVKVLSTMHPSSYIDVMERLACNFKNRHLFPEISLVLTTFYLDNLHSGHGLSNQVKYIIRRKDGMFKRRFDWLDNIYPLQGSTKMCSNCEEREACPCTACNAYLLKLQCLLCSDLLNEVVLNSISGSISNYPKLQSIHLLCLRRMNISEFVNIILDKHTQLVTKVLEQPWDIQIAKALATETFRIQREIQKQNQFQKKDCDSSKRKLLLKDILAILSERMPPQELFSILPPDGNSRFFIPYVMRCLELQQSQKVYQDLQKTVQSFI